MTGSAWAHSHDRCMPCQCSRRVERRLQQRRGVPVLPAPARCAHPTCCVHPASRSSTSRRSPDASRLPAASDPRWASTLVMADSSGATLSEGLRGACAAGRTKDRPMPNRGNLGQWRAARALKNGVQELCVHKQGWAVAPGVGRGVHARTVCSAAIQIPACSYRFSTLSTAP